MNFVCQSSALSQLHTIAKSGKHSILIEGPPGCGKTYLARRYAEMLNVSDFQVIESSVQSIRETIEACYNINTPVVICIENLDKGVSAASYSLLKFLEEPASYVYIVVTCRNLRHIPETIISRSVCVTTSPPIDTDLLTYGKNKNADRCEYLLRSHNQLWSCLRSFADVDTVLTMSDDHLNYFTSLSGITAYRDSISNMMWRLGHYNDNSEAPVELVIRYLISLTDSNHIRSAGISCLSDISQGRVAEHAAIARFLIEVKYCE